MLIDFGLAEPAGSVSSGGTPWYVGPELRAGILDSQSDVYALGVVSLYAMRRIILPEKWRRHPEWLIRNVRRKVPAALRALHAWEEEVKAQGEALKASSGRDSRGTELRNIVYRMLLPWRNRIQLNELAGFTGKWDLSPFLETGQKDNQVAVHT